MKRSGLLLSACLLFYVQLSFGQYHDFDSLYTNDSEFKSQTQQIQDTLDVFNDETLLKIKIYSDFKNLIKNKLKGEYQPATIEYLFNDTVLVSRDIKIKPRGNYRRKNCYYPPITLNFPKKEALLKQFQEFDKLKFVDNCKAGESSEQLLLSEYYAYKIYNLLTPYSFRVRLLQVEFVDLGKNNKSRINYAFIIEDVDQMAGRLNGINFNKQNVHSERTDHDLATLMYIYQYMIGNTDWSIPVLHNIKLIKVNDVDLPSPIAIPYDFDYSGIVNAYYAVPNDQLPIKSVRERYYHGFCRNMDELKKSFELYNQKKDRILGLYQSSAYLSEKNVKETVSYLEDFYRVINNDGEIQNAFIQNCRK